jgi:hypothetical protein
MSIFGAIFVIFVVLKLTGVIDWSWWIITAPFWISALVWLMVFMTYILFCGFTLLFI